jgi:hypothetical protein
MSVSFGILIKFEDEMTLSRRCGGMWKRFNANGEASIAPSTTPARLTRASIVVAMLGNYSSESPKASAIVCLKVDAMRRLKCIEQESRPNQKS